MLKATYCALAMLIGAAIGGVAPKEWSGKELSVAQAVAFVPARHVSVR